MTWRVRRADVDFFVNDLWKDLRSFPATSAASGFAKDCFDPRAALIEATVLLLLQERLDPMSFPTPVAVEESVLVMERIPGVRLFDLIRHLRHIDQEQRDGVGIDVIQLLLARATEQLRLIQCELYSLRSIFTQETYPLEQKLRGLLDLFVRVMDIRTVPPEWVRCLEDFVDYWSAECVAVPFRDATTKNMIVGDEQLNLAVSHDDSESAQREAVRQALSRQEMSYWASVPIVNIDFTSITHLTSPEDDPISLLCHEWTFGSRLIDPASFVLDACLGSPDAKRCAASFLVRYLRFGGRKLAYKLINAQGFKTRFAYDKPLFYFDQLPDICLTLSPEFCREFGPLLDVIRLIADQIRQPSPHDVALMSVDHVRKHFPNREYAYWQQNPLEWQSSNYEGRV